MSVVVSVRDEERRARENYQRGQKLQRGRQRADERKARERQQTADRRRALFREERLAHEALNQARESGRGIEQARERWLAAVRRFT